MSGMFEAEWRRCDEASAVGIKMEMIKLWSKLVEVTVTMVWMLMEEKMTRRGSRGEHTFFGLDNQQCSREYCADRRCDVTMDVQICPYFLPRWMGVSKAMQA